MTPGAYLRKRREAAGLAVTDVAAAIATEPRLAEHFRVEWVAGIEADAMPARFDTLVALRNVFPFDFHVLERFVAIAMGAPLPAPRICRACACSENDACISGAYPCSWAGADICSRCAAVVTTAPSPATQEANP